MVSLRIVCALLVWCAGCVQSGIRDGAEPPDVDPQFFRCEVQPVLAARCAFTDCHGTLDRALPLYAEQRLRLDLPWPEYETPLTGEELTANYQAVLGFLAHTPSEPGLLSEKPLDTRAGGLYHRARDLYGDADVFVSRDDLGYQLLVDFAAGARAEPTCVAREEVGP